MHGGLFQALVDLASKLGNWAVASLFFIGLAVWTTKAFFGINLDFLNRREKLAASELNAWEQIRKLEALGLTEAEFEASKARILKNYGIPRKPAKATSSALEVQQKLLLAYAGSFSGYLVITTYWVVVDHLELKVSVSGWFTLGCLFSFLPLALIYKSRHDDRSPIYWYLITFAFVSFTGIGGDQLAFILHQLSDSLGF